MKQKGKKRVGGAPPVFEDSVKIAVAREYLEGNLSYKQLSEKYKLPRADTSQYFVRWYKRWLADQPEPDPQSSATPSQNDLDVHKQLKQANLRITALEMIIKNAEKELGVDIIKKSGTKRQGK
jgi:hypothetical protein